MFRTIIVVSGKSLIFKYFVIIDALSIYRSQTCTVLDAYHSSFRKVTKKGAFPNEDALIKLLYLRVTELSRKWSSGKVRNWSLVLNQLLQMDKFKERIIKYSSDF